MTPDQLRLHLAQARRGRRGWDRQRRWEKAWRTYHPHLPPREWLTLAQRAGYITVYEEMLNAR